MAARFIDIDLLRNTAYRSSIRVCTSSNTGSSAQSPASTCNTSIGNRKLVMSVAAGGRDGEVRVVDMEPDSLFLFYFDQNSLTGEYDVVTSETYQQFLDTHGRARSDDLTVSYDKKREFVTITIDNSTKNRRYEYRSYDFTNFLEICTHRATTRYFIMRIDPSCKDYCGADPVPEKYRVQHVNILFHMAGLTKADGSPLDEPQEEQEEPDEKEQPVVHPGKRPVEDIKNDSEVKTSKSLPENESQQSPKHFATESAVADAATCQNTINDLQDVLDGLSLRTTYPDSDEYSELDSEPDVDY